MGKTEQRRRYTSQIPLAKSLAAPSQTPPTRNRLPRKVKLPQDIINVIVDYLGDEPANLKACSLTSKSFLLQTRRHLFRRFHVKLSHSTRNLRLAEVFNNSPYLKECIKDLTVVVPPTADRLLASFEEEIPLISILSTFKQVMTMTITAFGGQSRDWDIDVSTTWRRALSSILMADCVRSVSIHDILNFDTLCLSRCLSLCGLKLSGNSTLTAYNPPPYFHNSPIRLSSLTVGASAEAFLSLVDCCMIPKPAFQLANLQSLEVEEAIATWAFEDMPFIFSTLSQFTVHLRLYPDESLPTPEPLDLSHFGKLAKLELRSTDDRKGMTFALRCARIVESVSHPHLLRDISFVYNPTPDRFAMTESSFNEAYWSCVDAALLHLPLSPSSSVHFKYGMGVRLSDSVDAFPRVRALGARVGITSLLA